MAAKILYNVTVKIVIERSEEWISWMRNTHIPDVMKTEQFESYKLTRIIEEETDGATFAIQYLSPSMAHFEHYQANHAKALQKEHEERYRNAYVAFRTLMEVVDEN